MAERWDDRRHAGGVWFGPEGEPDGEPSDAFRERVERFERCARDEALYGRLFSELGFTFIDDGCEGYCPDCERRAVCEVYPELKGEWEALE